MKRAVYKMIMMLFAITLYARCCCCWRHLVGQQTVSDVSIVLVVEVFL